MVQTISAYTPLDLAKPYYMTTCLAGHILHGPADSMIALAIQSWS